MVLYKFQTSNLMYAVNSENPTLLKELLDVYSPHSLKSGLWYNLMNKADRIQNFEVIELLLWDFHVNNKNKHASQTPLHTAVLKDNLSLIASLLNRGADINSIDEFGNTPLHFATENQNYDAVRLLLNRKADFNVKNNLNVTPLCLAVYLGDLQIVEYLLIRGATVNTICTINDLKDYTPIHFAAISNNNGKKIMELLLKKGIDVNSVEKNGLTALHLAISKGCRPIIDLLLQQANINVESNTFTISPLCVAAACGDFRTVTSLINRKAHVNRSCDYDKYSKSFTPLHLAAKNGNQETVEILLKRGANVEARNKNGETALHVSIDNGHIEVVQLLIRYGASVDSVISKWEVGLTPLHQAIGTDNKEIIKLLISEGANINAVAPMLPIHYAATKGKGHIIKILFDNGIYVDTLDENGKTPLITAIEAKKSESVKWILKYCPNLKCKSNEGLLNNIDYDDKQEYKKILAMFFKHGVIIERENVCNTLLIYTAIELGFVNILEKLLELGANPNTIVNNELSYSMLHVACRFNQEKIAKLLITKGADVNFKDRKLQTPLFLSTVNNNINLIKLLLNNFADVNAKDQDSQTVLHISVLSSYDDIVRLLLNNGADINCDIFFELDVDDEDTDEDYYDDYDDTFMDNYYENENRRKTAKILKKHVIKLKTANLSVADEYLNSIYDEWGLIEKCEKEVEAMKKDKIYNDVAHITYYSILTKNLHTVAIYLKNNEIKKALISCNFKRKYPLYSNMLKYRCEQAIKRNQLFEKEPGMSIFKICPMLPYVCVDEIFSYLDNPSLHALELAMHSVPAHKSYLKTSASYDVQEITRNLPSKKIRMQ